MNKSMSTVIVSAPQKIEELESIRGLAAFLVVFFHLPKWHPVLNVGFINNGYLMVELFFVISGFVIYNAYAERIDGGKDLLRFQFLRFGRLYPVHLLFLFAFLLIEIAKYVVAKKFGIVSPNSVPFQVNSISALLQNIFLVSALIPYADATFNYPAWSISVEFYTYLMFAGVILIFKKRKNYIFLMLAVVSLFALLTNSAIGFDSLLKCFAGFFVGCLTAKVVKFTTTRVPAYLSTLVFIAIVLFVQMKVAKDFDYLIYPLTASLIASLVLSDDGLLKRFLRLRTLTWLGAISYSVYMSHAAVEWFVNQVIRFGLKKLEIVDAGGVSIPQLTQVETVVACIVVATLVLTISTIVFNLIEKPMREQSRRFAAENLT